jgi:ABC-2 type transport system permease protein
VLAGHVFSSLVLTLISLAGLRWFAENQPFTPITNTVRSLLANQHVGSAGVKAIVSCLAITAASYLWARYLYNRRPVQ